RSGGGPLRSHAQTRRTANGVSAFRRAQRRRGGEEGAGMAERSVPQPRVPGEMGAGDSRMVVALGQEGIRLVVRWLLLAEYDVPDGGGAQFRKLRGGGPRGQSRQRPGIQPRCD